MVSGYAGGEMMEDAGFRATEGGYFGSAARPGCNCGAQ